jgi:hypothetical protein
MPKIEVRFIPLSTPDGLTARWLTPERVRASQTKEAEDKALSGDPEKKREAKATFRSFEEEDELIALHPESVQAVVLECREPIPEDMDAAEVLMRKATDANDPVPCAHQTFERLECRVVSGWPWIVSSALKEMAGYEAFEIVMEKYFKARYGTPPSPPKPQKTTVFPVVRQYDLA